MNDPVLFVIKQGTPFSNDLFSKMLGTSVMFMENWLLISTDFMELPLNSINPCKNFGAPQYKNFRCFLWHQRHLSQVAVV